MYPSRPHEAGLAGAPRDSPAEHETTRVTANSGRAPALSARARSALWILLAVGAVGRVVLAFKTYGVVYDSDSFRIVRDALRQHPLHVYSIVNGHPYLRWPYPPGFLPWIAAAGAIASATGSHFGGWLHLPQIAADLAIAWVVQDLLGRRSAGELTRLAAVALVMFGPSFWILSGYHGQIDQLAILMPLLALWSWDRMPAGVRRGLVAGALIGVGATIKTVPVLMLFALLPTTRGYRERIVLFVTPAIIVLIAVAPFLIADAHGIRHAIGTQRALPGFGGLSLVVQPDLVKIWLGQPHAAALSPLNQTLFHYQQQILAVLMLPFLAIVIYRRVPAVQAAALLWLAVLILNTGGQYAVWALPFALAAGFVWQAALVEAVLVPPLAVFYFHPYGHSAWLLYAPFMIPLWIVLAVTTVVWGVRILRSRPAAQGPVTSGAAVAAARG